MMITADTPEETFLVGNRIGESLSAGDIVLLYGGLGAGKTLLIKGILNALEYDIDEVTSPSFTLVNLYKTSERYVYHIDLWRLDGPRDPAREVGLSEILEDENAIVIIEWANRLTDSGFQNRTITVHLKGDGDEPRQIEIKHSKAR
ncbi:MAG: tRNA (adenosine(37)-N6)-threonylcarbamoyltransferase complex ATPase subunit type 1 TsaE [Pyrinomonadaceae bacterium]